MTVGDNNTFEAKSEKDESLCVHIASTSVLWLHGLEGQPRLKAKIFRLAPMPSLTAFFCSYRRKLGSMAAKKRCEGRPGYETTSYYS